MPRGFICGYPTKGGDLYGGGMYTPSAAQGPQVCELFSIEYCFIAKLCALQNRSGAMLAGCPQIEVFIFTVVVRSLLGTGGSSLGLSCLRSISPAPAVICSHYLHCRLPLRAIAAAIARAARLCAHLNEQSIGLLYLLMMICVICCTVCARTLCKVLPHNSAGSSSNVSASI